MDQEALELEQLAASVARYTKSGEDRIRAMCEAVRRVDRRGIAGDIVECGVWRGGNIILARKLSPLRHCWLYDTFDGMPMPEEIDVSASGKRAIDSYLGRKKPGGKWSAVTAEQVKQNLIDTDTWNSRLLTFVEGKVEDTLLVQANLPERIALLRLDTDWHASTKVEMEVLYPRLESGGILIVDDYGHWKGARKAVDDYFDGRGPKLTPIDYTAVLAVKP